MSPWDWARGHAKRLVQRAVVAPLVALGNRAAGRVSLVELRCNGLPMMTWQKGGPPIKSLALPIRGDWTVVRLDARGYETELMATRVEERAGTWRAAYPEAVIHP